MSIITTIGVPVIFVLGAVFLGYKKIASRGKLGEQSPRGDFVDFGRALIGFAEAIGALIIWLIYYIIMGLRWGFSGLFEKVKTKEEKAKEKPLK